MDPVQKALWFVETHSRTPITLEEIARACHVSSFHLTRAFAETMGVPLMRYVRGRRLSDAARRLAQGGEEILPVALDAGYGSHEAFTRAFRELFTLTPEQVRAQGHVGNLSLVEAIAMDATSLPSLEPPRFERLGECRFAGLVERYRQDGMAGIPDQWQRFTPYLGAIPGQIGPAAYGVCYNFDPEGTFDYMCGVEVRDLAQLPKEFGSVRVAPQQYAVFTHKDHIASIRSTFTAIWSQWFPTSGFQAAPAPLFERYGPEFDPATGRGGLEIWIPVVS